MITIIPSVLISHALTREKITELDHFYMDNAKWYANFHAQHIDNFIGETIARLDMMSKLIHTQQQDLNKVQEILIKTHEEDNRFSGFYWANTNGDLLIGSNEMPTPVNILDRQYFQDALKLKETTVSEPHLGRVTGRFVISIATPVSQNGQVEGVLIASLRLDEIQDFIIHNIHDENIIVSEESGKKLFETSPSFSNYIEYHTNINKVPWVVTAKILPKENISYGHNFLKHLGILLIITHILFILFHYFALKNKLRNQKKELKFQKLEVIGDLAASTAHEIRNPLTGIKGLIQLLSEKYTDKQDQLYFKVIQDEVNRINGIVSELLLIGKPTAYHFIQFDMHDAIKEIIPIIQSETNYANVQFTFSPSNSALPIFSVKDHLKQVIINLSKNAIESMPNGGSLDISIQKQLDFCIVQVKDNGIGIESDALKHIFDPFFTMKEDGTGLGLTVCKRIIDNIGGTISIQSKIHQGTEVTIKIPLYKENHND